MGTLTMTRGDTKTVTETIQPKDALGNQVLGANGIAGWSFWMTAKYDAGDADSAAVFQKVPINWTANTNGNQTTAGVATCTLNPSDTSALPPYQVTLVYDVQAKDTSGNIFTIDSGTLTVTPDVTIATV